jgi:hypothetical protein
VFAGTYAPPQVLPPRDILRFLRLITSPTACRGEKRVPLSVVAELCGVARITLYQVLWTGRASDELCAVLTPLIRQYEAGKLRLKRASRYGDQANRWEILEP